MIHLFYLLNFEKKLYLMDKAVYSFDSPSFWLGEYLTIYLID